MTKYGTVAVGKHRSVSGVGDCIVGAQGLHFVSLSMWMRRINQRIVNVYFFFPLRVSSLFTFYCVIEFSCDFLEREKKISP